MCCCVKVTSSPALSAHHLSASMPRCAAAATTTMYSPQVPQGTKVLIGEVEKIGPEEALSQVRAGGRA